MKPEEKQALIEWCEWRIARGSKSTMSEQTLRAAKITLAALTAQPVKLPPRRSMLTREDIDQDYVTCMAISVEDAIASIRAAGYEVQE